MMRNSLRLPFEELPDELSVFPLPGVLLLPNGRLPLNVFEPRYLNMVLDSLGEERLIGLVQATKRLQTRFLTMPNCLKSVV